MKCRENRARRRKRDRREQKRILARDNTLVIRQVLRDSGGKNPDYYDVILPRTWVATRNGIRRAMGRGVVRVVPNEKYHALMRELMRMCGDATVEIPRDVTMGGEPA